MTPDEIRSRLARLRRAGARLRARPARERVDRLADVLDAWRAPDSKWRRALLDALPQATGFSAAMVEEGLARGLDPWTGDALRGQVALELGDADRLRRSFEVVSVLLAGSIPMPSLQTMLAPLVLGSPVLVKPASRDPVTPGLVARSLEEVDPELGGAVDVVAFSGGDDACVRTLLEADCVVVTGSDATVAAVAGHADPSRRLVCYGHRLSVAVTGGQLRGAALGDAMARLALDVALWDQLGCLSPIELYVLGGGETAADDAADALAAALDTAERRWPRGAIDPRSAAAIAYERADAEMRAAAGRKAGVRASAGTRWTVVREDGPARRPAPLHRFVRVVPVPDPEALEQALRPLARHLAGIGVAGVGADALPDLGPVRVCPLGTLQSPPLGWRDDGRGLLRPLRSDPQE